MSEQIQKQVPKQRQRTYEHTQEFPAKEIPEDEILALADLALEHIEETLEATE